MSLKALLYAYVLGGVTFIPLVAFVIIYFTIYTSIPVEKADVHRNAEEILDKNGGPAKPVDELTSTGAVDINDVPRPRKGWLTMRRTFEEPSGDASYVTLVKSFLDARSKDPKRSRPKDMWYVVLKGKVLFLYEDEAMMECEAAVELGSRNVVIFPEGLLDGELFVKRNAICLKPKVPPAQSMANDTMVREEEIEEGMGRKVNQAEREVGDQKRREQEEALNPSTPWFIFVRSPIEMEDWYLALIHASNNPANCAPLLPLQRIFLSSDMNHLVTTLDEQPDVIPMRWLNAIIGRLFFSYYRTRALEAEIIRRLMRKLSKVKRPAFLTDILVTDVSVGNKAPTFSKPMLKELTKEGDASMEVHVFYKGEVRITVEATATINLGARFKSYTVKLVLAAVLKEIEGNLLVKVKRPPSSRFWYAFTATPRMVLQVEPIVSDRQITWGMILSTIEARLKEIIQESVVMPNMDDIAFFHSSPYTHRGGIWPDASRREQKPLSTATEDSSNVPTVSLEEPVGISVGPPQPSLTLHDHSSEEITPEAEALPPMQEVPVVHAATVDSIGVETSALPPPSTSVPARRRWFSGSDALDGEAYTDGFDRDGIIDDTPSIQSRSVGGTDTSNTNMNPGPYSRGTQSTLQPIAVHRSSSQNSLSSSAREHSQSSSFADMPLSPNLFSSTPSTPSHKSHQPSRSTGNTPSSTSTTSFLTKLKSRAGDKEALSKSAQETMRKWGVNWGGLKRENNDDIADHGFGDSRSRVESSGSSWKGRGSYADIRAAVAERKGQGRPLYEESNNTLSTPIAIPDGGRGASVSNSFSRSVGSPSSSEHPSSVQSPSRQRSDSVEAGNSSAFVGIPISRTNTRGSNRSSEVAPEVAGQEPLASSLPTAVHTQQPSGKTMTIPGIHASHRGDVMSMGYVAPRRPPGSAPEDKNRSPAIQTVYRLWKNQVPAEQQLPTQDAADSELYADTAAAVSESEPVPLAVNSTSQSPPKSPRPPPLPPRSLPTAAPISRPPLEAPKLSSELGQSASPASESLKSIATRDANKRLSLEKPRSPSPDLPSMNALLDDIGGSENLRSENLADIPESSARTEPPLPRIPVPS